MSYLTLVPRVRSTKLFLIPTIKLYKILTSATCLKYTTKIRASISICLPFRLSVTKYVWTAYLRYRFNHILMNFVLHYAYAAHSVFSLMCRWTSYYIISFCLLSTQKLRGTYNTHYYKHIIVFYNTICDIQYKLLNIKL